MKQNLQELIDRVGIRVYGRELRKIPALHQWVLDTTSYLPEDASIAERVFIALYGPEQSICEYGNKKLFNAINKGFRFCAKDCRCRCEEQSRKIKLKYKEYTPEKLKKMDERKRATMVKRYGVENPGQVPGIAEKIRATSLARYGTEHASQSAEVRAKTDATNLRLYGTISPQSLDERKEKVKETNLKRYGTENTMHLAREAFAAANDGAHPLMLPEYQEKARASMLERHGVEKALQNSEILARMKAGVQEKHGVDNVMQSDIVQASFHAKSMEKYNRHSPGQSHFSDETYAILNDKTAFKALFETMSLREVAISLGIGYDTGRKYCERHGIELPMSSYETAIASFLRANNLGVIVNDRTIIKPREIDFVIPDKKVGIEFCGLYWHNERNKRGRNYHLDKLDSVNKAGYRLITIFEDEWVYKRPIVEMRLLHILGRSQVGAAARKLRIDRVDGDQARAFMNTYHLQGGTVSGYANYAAFDGDTIVAMMTFSKPRLALGRKEDGADELLRFATDGKTHSGIASRLFKAYVTEYKPDEVISYADRRWSDGGLYRALGFLTEEVTDPNYWYVHPNHLQRDHRFGHRKDRIVNLVENGDTKTEAEIMIELGYNRIWDCGHFKFTWKRAVS